MAYETKPGSDQKGDATFLLPGEKDQKVDKAGGPIADGSGVRNAGSMTSIQGKVPPDALKSEVAQTA